MTLAIEFDGLWHTMYATKPDTDGESLGDLVRVNHKLGVVVGVFENPETAREWVEEINERQEAA